MNKYIKRSRAWAVSIVSFIFMFVPEEMFKSQIIFSNLSIEKNVIINRGIVFLAVFFLALLVNAIYLGYRRKVNIKGKNYTIQIKYGDLFKQKDCKVVIPFDECFTTNVGMGTADINPKSLCGQYLQANPSVDIEQLIHSSGILVKGKSKYAGKEKYESGRVIQNGQYLLMAFAKLDKVGKGILTREEYIESLSVLWEELDNYYGQQDVCIPILGSGTTRIGDNELTQQELLDIIINSYKLSVHRIKKPNKLCIVCRNMDDFSLNKIEGI